LTVTKDFVTFGEKNLQVRLYKIVNNMKHGKPSLEYDQIKLDVINVNYLNSLYTLGQLAIKVDRKNETLVGNFLLQLDGGTSYDIFRFAVTIGNYHQFVFSQLQTAPRGEGAYYFHIFLYVIDVIHT